MHFLFKTRLNKLNYMSYTHSSECNELLDYAFMELVKTPCRLGMRNSSTTRPQTRQECGQQFSTSFF